MHRSYAANMLRGLIRVSIVQIVCVQSKVSDAHSHHMLSTAQEWVNTQNAWRPDRFVSSRLCMDCMLSLDIQMSFVHFRHVETYRFKLVLERPPYSLCMHLSHSASIFFVSSTLHTLHYLKGINRLPPDRVRIKQGHHDW